MGTGKEVLNTEKTNINTKALKWSETKERWKNVKVMTMICIELIKTGSHAQD